MYQEGENFLENFIELSISLSFYRVLKTFMCINISWRVDKNTETQACGSKIESWCLSFPSS